MGRKNSKRGRPQAAKRVWVDGIRRDQIDQRKLGLALLALAEAANERPTEKTDLTKKPGRQPHHSGSDDTS